MISVETHIDGKYTSTTNGDGVIVSTPTGSTAYSLSAGGPIIAPTCHCTVLTPLSPHNLTMRPIVVPDTSLIELHIRTRSNIASISVDNRTFEVQDNTVLRIKTAKRKILLAISCYLVHYLKHIPIQRHFFALYRQWPWVHLLPLLHINAS